VGSAGAAVQLKQGCIEMLKHYVCFFQCWLLDFGCSGGLVVFVAAASDVSVFLVFAKTHPAPSLHKHHGFRHI
jgi:hypothetical protein